MLKIDPVLAKAPIRSIKELAGLSLHFISTFFGKIKEVKKIYN